MRKIHMSAPYSICLVYLPTLVVLAFRLTSRSAATGPACHCIYDDLVGTILWLLWPENNRFWHRVYMHRGDSKRIWLRCALYKFLRPTLKHCSLTPHAFNFTHCFQCIARHKWVMSINSASASMLR